VPEGTRVLHTIFRYAIYAVLAFAAWGLIGLAIVLASNFIAWLTGWRLKFYPRATARRATVCVECGGEDCLHTKTCKLADMCSVCGGLKGTHDPHCPLAPLEVER
jgi:hypothetical protein